MMPRRGWKLRIDVLRVMAGAIFYYAALTTLVLAGGGAMGSWGLTTFESDAALDFLRELRVEEPYPAFQSAVSLASDAYIEEDQGARALVVGELLAAKRDGDATHLPEAAREVLSKMKTPPPAALVAAARSAVERVLLASEMRDLRAELGAPEFDRWQNGLRDILKRLQ
jgi:hypothetical protein